MTNELLIYGENVCAFPHILESPSSYMTLHPIPSEFLTDEENFVFFFISAPFTGSWPSGKSPSPHLLSHKRFQFKIKVSENWTVREEKDLEVVQVAGKGKKISILI